MNFKIEKDKCVKYSNPNTVLDKSLLYDLPADIL